MIASVHTNRLPSIYSPTSATDKSLLFMARSPAPDAQDQPPFYPQLPTLFSTDPSNNIDNRLRDNSAFGLNQYNDKSNEQIIVGDDLNLSNNNNIEILENQNDEPSSASMTKRIARNQILPNTHHNHQHTNNINLDPSSSSSHFDVCFVSYEVKDLGHHFYPRYIESADCKPHMPPALEHRIKCVPIHYHVQVLTQRKDSDPEDTAQGSSNLPESLKDFRFVLIPVNVGCHCSVVV